MADPFALLSISKERACVRPVPRKLREEKSLYEAAGELNCDNLTIITWDQAGEATFKDMKITLTPLWQWLL